MKIRAKIIGIMTVPFFFLGGSTLAVLNASNQTNRGLQEERNAQAVAEHFQQVETDVLDAENATKEYLLVAEDRSLKPYHEAIDRFPVDMTTLSVLAAGGQLSLGEAQELRSLAVRRFTLLRALQRLAPVTDATNHARLKRLMGSGASVRQRFLAFVDREEAEAATRLQVRKDRLDAARRTWSLVGRVGMPLGMLVSLSAVGLYTQRFARRIGRTRAVARLLDEGMPLGEPSRSKDELGELERGLIRTGTRLVELQGELRRMGTADGLTRLLNRRGFIPSAEHQLEVAKRTSQTMALAFLDLDGLKLVNDTLGHAAGDAMITEAAYALVQTFRGSDLIGRMGGDEFCVLYATESETDARAALARLDETVQKTNEQQGRPFLLSLSAGLAMLDPHHPSTLDVMMGAADEQMYEVKRAKTASQSVAAEPSTPIGATTGHTAVH